MFDNLKLRFDPNCEMIEALFTIRPDTVEKLDAALESGKLAEGSYGHWDGEKGAWFCGYLHMSGEEFQIGADHESGEVRLAMYPKYDRLDGTAPVPVADHWVEFIRPLKRLKELLQ